MNSCIFIFEIKACDVLDAILVEPFSQRQRVVVAQTEKTQLLASPSPTPSDGVRNNKNGQNKVFTIQSSNFKSKSELDI